jgi:phosphate transport system substrate-binding protein
MVMKRILMTVVVGAGCMVGAGTAGAQKIKGSDTMLPLTQKVAEAFMKANPGATVTVTGGGSGVGIAALLEGTTDIAQASRKIKFEEVRRLREKGEEVEEVVAARDALAIVVHPSNPVGELTREQLEGIFTGKVRNWKEVGGEDMAIVPYARESSSGTYEFFKESVLGEKSYVNGIMSMPATGAVMQSVSQTRGAIGYVGLAYVNGEVKALRVSYDGGRVHVAPSVQSARDGSYPVVRELFFYFTTRTGARARAFVEFLLSVEGQRAVEGSGFVTVD